MNLGARYILTTFLISFFIFTLLSTNWDNCKLLSRLREDVDEMTMLIQAQSGGTVAPRQLTELIDTILKKRLSGVWDDLLSVKKQLKANDCATGMGKRKGTPEDNAIQAPRLNYASVDLGAKISNPPIYMLDSSMEPGRCFAFRKDRATVTVRLTQPICVETIELEHIVPSLTATADATSAPKCFSVYGLVEARSQIEAHLGTFEYTNSPTQRTQAYAMSSVNKYQYLRFKFESNHGHPDYTCVYRIAVYGKV